MRNVLIILFVLLILGGGYYYYEQSSPVPEEHTLTESEMQAQMPNSGETTTAPTGGEEVSGAKTDTVKEFTVTGSSFAFAPNTLSVKKGDTVKIIFKNSGGMHDFVIDEFSARTKQIQGGSEDSVTFVADKAGAFEYYCSVGKHRQMGMKGTLTVTE